MTQRAALPRVLEPVADAEYRGTEDEERSENINARCGECSPKERWKILSSREEVLEGGAGGSPERTEPTEWTSGASDLTSPDRAKGKWEGVESATERTRSTQEVVGAGGVTRVSGEGAPSAAGMEQLLETRPKLTAKPGSMIQKSPWRSQTAPT